MRHAYTGRPVDGGLYTPSFNTILLDAKHACLAKHRKKVRRISVVACVVGMVLAMGVGVGGAVAQGRGLYAERVAACVQAQDEATGLRERVERARSEASSAFARSDKSVDLERVAALLDAREVTVPRVSCETDPDAGLLALRPVVVDLSTLATRYHEAGVR